MADNENDNTNSVAKVMEISARSTQSFDHAMQTGIQRATSTLRGVTSAWVKEQRLEINDGKVVGYQVNMLITFTLEG